MKKTVRVVGAIIINEEDKVLCALRSPEMTLPNYWEFPGGKIEFEESIQDAVIREIKEELDCGIEALKLFNDYTHEYDHIIVNLVTVICKLINGIPKASEHSELRWVSKSDLRSLHWAPADIPAVELLSK